MKWTASIIVYFILSSACGQSLQLVDSLERNLNGYNEDDRAFALYTLVGYYQRSDQAKALYFRKQARELLKDGGVTAQTYAFIIEGIFSTGVGKLDSAEYWFFKAKETAKVANNTKTLTIICASIGRTLIAAGKTEQAVANLMEGLRLTDIEPNPDMMMRMRINLVWAYLELKRYRDGVNLGLQTLKMMNPSQEWMALYLYNNMAVCYGALNQLDSAKYLVDKGITAAEVSRDYQQLANAHFILGTIYSNAGRNDLAIAQYEKAIPIREKVGNPFFIVSDLYTLSALYQKTGLYSKGVATGLEALSVAKEHNLLLKFENTYQVLAMNYEGLRDYKNSSAYYELWAAAKDSIYQRANARAIADMQTKYETEKKEQQIALQDATISAQRANIERNYVLIAALTLVVILGIIIVLLVRGRTQRKQETLKKEYELSLKEAFISASIQSQENERKRFAQDLHDGMGQLISALRFIVGPTKPVISIEKREETMAKAESILNDMHREIRSVAYNLMPQTLIKQGLAPAIQEMAARINDSGQLKFTTNSFDLPDRFKEIVEISLYRVVQEWVNNILKYAGARSVQVQLVAHENEITLTIEDDGTGFDKSVLDHSPGNGWKNILSRLSLIKATVELDTVSGRKGTTLMVTMPWLKGHEGEKTQQQTQQNRL